MVESTVTIFFSKEDGGLLLIACWTSTLIGVVSSSDQTNHVFILFFKMQCHMSCVMLCLTLTLAVTPNGSVIIIIWLGRGYEDTSYLLSIISLYLYLFHAW